MKRYRLMAFVLSVFSILLVACGSEPLQATAVPVAPVAAPAGITVPRPAPVAEAPRIVPVAPVPGLFELTILHNNDGESQLANLGSGLEEYGGVVHFEAAVQREKQAVASAEGSSGKREVLMLSSGDNFLPGPEFAAGQRAGVYYDAMALDIIGYDAIALGNHDFDMGPDVLAEFIRQVSRSQAPFLSSNLDFTGEPVLRDLYDAGRIAESIVIEKNGERIGIIGATTPDLNIISSPRRVKVIRNVAGEIQAEVGRLEADGVNKIILISHLQDIEADIEIVRQVQGIDVAVAGGGDQLLANECDLLIPDQEPFGPYPMMATDRTGNGVPLVTTAGQYSYLGKLVVTFDAKGVLVNIDENASHPIRIASGDDPVSVQADFDDCKARLANEEFVQAGQMQKTVISGLVVALDDLAQPFASSQVDLEGRRSEVRSRETNQGNLMADALLWQANELALEFGATPPDVALQNGGAIRNDLILPAGQIREIDTFDMAPFGNMVTVVEGVSRGQFKEILENSVSRVVEGDMDGGSGRFAQVSGFSFEWSESGTAHMLNSDGSVAKPGTRIQKVVMDNGEVIIGGGNVISGPDLTVATSDFLARGGDEYPFRGASFTPLGVVYQQALARFIQLPGGINGTITSDDYPQGGEGRITRLP